jgi:hypothetical protein
MSKKRKYPLGQTVCGIIGMLIMIYVIEPDWGEGALGAGLECGLGYGLGASIFLLFRYAFFCKSNTDEIKQAEATQTTESKDNR